MTITNDIGLSTILIGFLIAAVGWGLKETAKSLILTLVKTIAKVEMLDAKLLEIVKAMAMFPKMQQDLNEYYARLKKIESELKARTEAGP